MTPEERKDYQEYLADFDPSPIGNGEDYIYPLSEDSWLEQREGALNALDRLYEENSEGLKRLANSPQEDNS